MAYPCEYFQKSADFLKTRFDGAPEIAIVLGSCLGPFAQAIEDPVTVDYADIPNFLRTTVSSHAGTLIFGTVRGVRVVCMSGRFHSYEGYDFQQLVIPVRVLKLLGVRAVLLTNAAGAVNTAYRPGDVMVIADHIKLNGAAQFETSAEIRAARILGADAVGMSTVTEALTAAHCRLPLLALSVMTNMAAGVLDRPLSDSEVDETARMIAGSFSEYVKTIIAAIHEALDTDRRATLNQEPVLTTDEYRF